MERKNIYTANSERSEEDLFFFENFIQDQSWKRGNAVRCTSCEKYGLLENTNNLIVWKNLGNSIILVKDLDCREKFKIEQQDLQQIGNSLECKECWKTIKECAVQQAEVYRLANAGDDDECLNCIHLENQVVMKREKIKKLCAIRGCSACAETKRIHKECRHRRNKINHGLVTNIDLQLKDELVELCEIRASLLENDQWSPELVNQLIDLTNQNEKLKYTREKFIKRFDQAKILCKYFTDEIAKLDLAEKEFDFLLFDINEVKKHVVDFDVRYRTNLTKYDFLSITDDCKSKIEKQTSKLFIPLSDNMYVKKNFKPLELIIKKNTQGVIYQHETKNLRLDKKNTFIPKFDKSIEHDRRYYQLLARAEPGVIFPEQILDHQLFKVKKKKEKKVSFKNSVSGVNVLMTNKKQKKEGVPIASVKQKKDKKNKSKKKKRTKKKKDKTKKKEKK